jgi:hypothetical protein
MRGGELAEAQLLDGTSAGVEELLTTGDTARDAGDGDPEVLGDGSQGQTVESDGGATEQGARIYGGAAEARTGDLLFADSLPGGQSGGEGGKECSGINRGQRGRVGLELREHLAHEVATAQDTFIAGPLLASAAELTNELPAAGAAAQSSTIEIGDFPTGGPVENELPVGTARVFGSAAELGEDEVGILGRERPVAEQDGMAGPGVVVQGVDADGEAGTDRVEVDVADEFEQVRFLLDQCVLEAVLEEVSGAVVAGVERTGVAAEEALHEVGEGGFAGTKQGVGVVGHEGPSVETGAAFQDQGRQAVEKVMAVVIAEKDLTAFDAADDDVVEGARVIKTGTTGHKEEANGTERYVSSSTQSTRETRYYVPLFPAPGEGFIPFSAIIAVSGNHLFQYGRTWDKGASGAVGWVSNEGIAVNVEFILAGPNRSPEVPTEVLDAYLALYPSSIPDSVAGTPAHHTEWIRDDMRHTLTYATRDAGAAAMVADADKKALWVDHLRRWVTRFAQYRERFYGFGNAAELARSLATVEKELRQSGGGQIDPQAYLPVLQGHVNEFQTWWNAHQNDPVLLPTPAPSPASTPTAAATP